MKIVMIVVVIIGLSLPVFYARNLFDTRQASGVFASANESGPQPIPSQYHFPTSSATVESWVAHADVAAIRGHGWDLWAGISSTTQERGLDGNVLPVWRTWWTQDRLIQGPPSLEALQFKQENVHFERPKQLRSQGVHFDRKLTAISDVTFNQIAVTVNVDNDYAQFVWAPHPGPNGINYSYFQAASLTQLNKAWPATTPTVNRKIDEFPPAAVSLKPTFQLVKAAQNATANNSYRGLTVLPLWSGNLETGPAHTYKPTAPDPSQWQRCVLVAPDPTDPRIGSTMSGVPCNQHTITDVPVVSVAAFYNFAVTADEADSFNQILSGNPAQKGDFAVLVAMHMSTKEIANWTWQTFWWTNGEHPYGDPPASLKTPWRNYEMQAAYFMTLPPNDIHGTNQLTYNPYLEAGGVTDGIHSNCMSCHATARFNVNENGMVDSAGYPCSYTRPNNFVAPGHGDDNSVYFDGQTVADFSWLIGTIPPPAGTGKSCAIVPNVRKMLHGTR